MKLLADKGYSVLHFEKEKAVVCKVQIRDRTIVIMGKSMSTLPYRQVEMNALSKLEILF